MFEGQMSLFGDLFEAPVVCKKEEKVKKEKKGGKKEAKPAVAAKTTLPVTLNVMGFCPVEITEEGAGKPELTTSELLEAVRKEAPWLPKEVRIEGDAVKFTGLTMAKGKVKDVKVFYWGPEQISLDEIPDEKRGELDAYLAEFARQFPEYASAVTGIATSGDCLYAIPDPKKADEHIRLPGEELTIQILSGEVIHLSREECIPLCGLESADDATDSSEIIPEQLKEFLPEYLRKEAVFVKNGEDSYIVVCKGQKSFVPEPKETLYSVKNAVISLFFEQFAVTAQDFGGKEEVSEKEIRDFLKQKGHPEYGFSENGLVITSVKDPDNKERTWLIVNTKGSKKGAQCHPFFDLSPDGFVWTGPKIPQHIFRDFAWTAWDICEKYDSEIIMELFYDERRREYFWFIPYQECSHASARSEGEVFIENRLLSGAVRIGTWHSHGRIGAFFSSVDDADERYPGLYCVIGGLGETTPQIRARLVGLNDVSLNISEESVEKKIAEKDGGHSGDFIFGNYADAMSEMFEAPGPSGFSVFPEYVSDTGSALEMAPAIAFFWGRFSDRFKVCDFSGKEYPYSKEGWAQCASEELLLLAEKRFDLETAVPSGECRTVSEMVLGSI